MAYPRVSTHLLRLRGFIGAPDVPGDTAVIAQSVAVDGTGWVSLSSNPDVILDLMALMALDDRPTALVAVVTERIPFCRWRCRDQQGPYRHPRRRQQRRIGALPNSVRAGFPGRSCRRAAGRRRRRSAQLIIQSRSTSILSSWVHASPDSPTLPSGPRTWIVTPPLPRTTSQISPFPSPEPSHS